MNPELTRSFPRVWSLSGGVAMVVTDLHGDWDAYQRYRACFELLHAQGQAEWLIFAGDLIHPHLSSVADRSLEIVLDVMALRERYGDRIIYLCGNHELPHIYGLLLSKGKVQYTPPFEQAMSASGQRERVLGLFESLPFFIRTAAGVTITHAGASHATIEPDDARMLWNWDHQAFLAHFDKMVPLFERAALRSGFAKLSGAGSYAELAAEALAVTDPKDPRFDNLLRGWILSSLPHFALLRAALFSKCEQVYGSDGYKNMRYADLVNTLLMHLSVEFEPQYLLVSGHISVQGGHAFVTPQHLRMASAAHARPREAGQCLLFDTGRPLMRIEELAAGLRPVFA